LKPGILLMHLQAMQLNPHPMPDTTFRIPTMQTQDDADAVMFELQDLPCVHLAGVDLPAHTAWVQHTAMIGPEDIAAKLQAAGFEAEVL
jgi:copper chaperone CopZ